MDNGKHEPPDFKYCRNCGNGLRRTFVEGRERPVCDGCGQVTYINPEPASAVMVVRDGSVLLVKRAVEPHYGEWCLPGGFIEWGESPEEAARRELREETGIEAVRLRLSGAYGGFTEERRHVVVFAYSVPEWTGEPVADDDALDVRWFPLDDRPPLAFKNQEKALADCVASGACG